MTIHRKIKQENLAMFTQPKQTRGEHVFYDPNVIIVQETQLQLVAVVQKGNPKK